MDIPFRELTVDENEKAVIIGAVRRVVDSGRFVLGTEVAAFESELASSVGAAHAVGVGSGTDALAVGMKSLGIGPGDEVIVPAFGAFPTAAAVVDVGARPVLVDVEAGRPLLDLASTVSSLTTRTRAVILVHLYGVPADARQFLDALAGRGIALIEDCAQAHGACFPSGGHVGTIGTFGAFSFYPTKTLGGIGDGGALVTNDDVIAAEARSWRSHGHRAAPGVHHLPARNSRLDEVHAAVLRERLALLSERIDHARRLCHRYRETLPSAVGYVDHGPTGSPHLSVVRVPDPDAVAARLARHGIGSGRHYPLALPDQPGLAESGPADTPNARRWASSCLSLPLHRQMTSADIDHVVEVVTKA